ncbi:MAG: PEP-CTERM sorting domain-containing protein [Mariniblastus sp.]
MKLRLLGNLITCIALTCLIGSSAMADVTGNSNGDGGTIPDNSSTGRLSTVTITDAEVISNAHFCIEGLDHDYIGDLIVTVSHSVSGKSATLMHRVGTTSSPTSTGDSSDVNGTYQFSDNAASIWTEAANGDTDYVVTPGTYSASGVNESLVSLDSIFAGETTAGVWTFNVSDNNPTQTGSFVQTSVKFTSAAVPEPGSIFILGTLLGGVMLRRRRR